MPIYEYRCGDCGHTLDALQKLSEAPLTDCPACEQPALRRLMSAPAFRLKGGGWYETDFKSDKEKKRNLAEGSEPKPSGEKPKGSDAAPASETAKKDSNTDSKKDTKKEGSGGETGSTKATAVA